MASTLETIDLARCRSDLAYYCENVLRIRTKDARLTPLTFNNAQRFVHERVSEQMREKGHIKAIVLKARQEGVSTYTAARFFRRMNLYRHQNGLVIADQKKRAHTLFGIYDMFHRMLPDEMRPEKRYAGKTELHFDSRIAGKGLNSKMSVETAKDVEAGRAATIQFLHASEFAFWDHAVDVWSGLMQAVPDTSSEVIIESTANGVGNLFHDIWLAAEEGESGFIPIFLPWWIHEEYQVLLTAEGVQEVLDTANDYEREALEEGYEWQGERHRLQPGQIAWRRQTIRDKMHGNERMFRQEYPATPREAFLVSGNCFFDEDVLQAYERHTKPPQRCNLSQVGSGGIVMNPSEQGWLRVWKRPKDDRHYAMFADTATGRQSTQNERASTDPESERGGRDFSAAYVVDVFSRDVVACLHGRIPPEVFAEQLQMLGHLYSTPRLGSGTRDPAFCGVERNHSSGETVLRWLKDHSYPRMFYMRRFNRRTQTTTSTLGWMTTTETRMPMLDELAAALREGSISLPDRDAIRECFTFIRGLDGKPEAQEGCHDDRVIALAGALQMMRYYPRSTGTRQQANYEVGDSPTGWANYG
jgi:hypothetical protein